MADRFDTCMEAEKSTEQRMSTLKMSFVCGSTQQHKLVEPRSSFSSAGPH